MKDAQIVVDQDGIFGQEVDNAAFLATTNKLFEQQARKNFDELKGEIIIKRGNQDKPFWNKERQGKQDELTRMINYYRSLLADDGRQRNSRGIAGDKKRKQKRSNQKSADLKAMNQLSRHFYDLLIKPIEGRIDKKKELIIIPDGILAYIPFEALQDSNGRYLGEKYRITYTQSMGVLELLKSRQYDNTRKSLLAFGGAIYRKPSGAKNSGKSEPIELNENLIKAMVNQIELANREGTPVFDLYQQLGISWQSLPGARKEVEKIGKMIRDAKVYTGETVTEERIKKLSRSGELKKYKVLHFATHGMVDSAIPELSAIVLSQFRNQHEQKEDGYLRIQEVAKLELAADFINLSACETGLGKIYGGEGVFGLTASFLMAGANGISSTLWQVDDQATMIFMESLYNLVNKEGMSYADAMTEVKRKFIRGEFGEKYKDSQYWASFVYYGLI
jgi:CHAT domain-containing protein